MTTDLTGKIVSHTDTRTGKARRGRVLRQDLGHYMTTTHGHAIWIVRWFDGSCGSGWRTDDLVTV